MSAIAIATTINQLEEPQRTGSTAAFVLVPRERGRDEAVIVTAITSWPHLRGRGH